MRELWRVRERLWLISMAWALVTGCDNGPALSTSTTEATVSGKVTLQGEPVGGGKVVFNPANHLRKFVSIREAAIGADGRYSIKTLVGSNAVSVEGPSEPKGSKTAKKAKRLGPGYEVRTFDVNAGENVYDIDVTPRRP